MKHAVPTFNIPVFGVMCIDVLNAAVRTPEAQELSVDAIPGVVQDIAQENLSKQEGNQKRQEQEEGPFHLIHRENAVQNVS